MHWSNGTLARPSSLSSSALAKSFVRIACPHVKIAVQRAHICMASVDDVDGKGSSQIWATCGTSSSNSPISKAKAFPLVISTSKHLSSQATSVAKLSPPSTAADGRAHSAPCEARNWDSPRLRSRTYQSQLQWFAHLTTTYNYRSPVPILAARDSNNLARILLKYCTALLVQPLPSTAIKPNHNST